MPIVIYGENNDSSKRFMVDGNATIWRYMDVGKYLDLITKEKLWFSRVVEMRKTDPYEGALTSLDKATITNILQASSKDALKLVFNPAFVDKPSMTLDKLKLIYLSMVGHHDHNVYNNMVSCWHENASESDAMWALYAQRNAGVAIKSTVHRVLKAFEATSETMWIAKINYDTKDNLSAMTNGSFDSILIKRHAFHHENEIRIIFHSLAGYEAPEWTEDHKVYRIDPSRAVPTGSYVDCDLSSLIEEVVISPLMPEYAVQAIEAVSRKVLPNIPIRQSTLSTSDDFRVNLPHELDVMWRYYQRTGKLADFNEIPPNEK